MIAAASELLGTSVGQMIGGRAGAGTAAHTARLLTENNYLSHNERVAFDSALVDCSRTNPQSCALKDQLSEISMQREENLKECEGKATNDCMNARAELLISAAQHLKSMGSDSIDL